MKKTVSIHGLAVSVENPKGSMRAGVGPGGSWQTEMRHDYGDITNAPQLGADGDPVDVFLGDNLQSTQVYVVNQTRPDGLFDEHKVMLGFDSQPEAESAYLANYEPGWTQMGTVTAMDTGSLMAWLHTGDLSQPAPAPLAQQVAAPSAATDAVLYDLQDAILIGDTQYEIVDSARPGKVAIKLLCSVANVVNENRRLYTTEFYQSMLPAANRYVDATDRYGEEPHPPFDKQRGQFVTSLANKVWEQGLWFVDAQGNLGCTVYCDPEKPREAAVIERAREKQKIANSVRWHAGRTPKKGRTTTGQSVDLFDAEVGQRIFAAVADYVPNPAFPEGGRVYTDATLLFPMTDATSPLLAVTLSDAPKPSEPFQAPAPVLPTPKEKKLKKTAAELRAQAAKVEDPEIKQSLLDAADSQEAADNAPPPLDAAGIAAQVREMLAPELAAATKASSYVDAAETERAAATVRAEVNGLADSVASGEHGSVARFTAPETRQEFAAVVRTAANIADATRALTDAIGTYDRLSSIANLAVKGLNLPGGGAPAGAPPRLEVLVEDGEKKVQQFTDAFNSAWDDMAQNNGNVPDPKLRATNAKFVQEKLLPQIFGEGRNARGRARISQAAMVDSAEFLLAPAAEKSKHGRISERAMVDAGMFEMPAVMDAAIGTGTVLNQATIALPLLERLYQDLTMLQYCQGLGPDSFEGPAGTQGNIGATLRVATEYYIPSDNDKGGMEFDSLYSGEDQGILEGGLQTEFQEFAVTPKGLAVALTRDVEMQLLHGPLHYDPMVRALYHTAFAFSRNTDGLLITEMKNASDELGAVPVVNEAVDVANITNGVNQDGLSYGGSVVAVAQIAPVVGGVAFNTGAVRNADTPNQSTSLAFRAPIIRPRPVSLLSGQGQRTNGILNDIVVKKGGGAPLVRGWLDPNFDIQPNVKGGAVDYAVDYARGKIVFAPSAGVTHATANLIISYTFTTNVEYFKVNFGAAGFPNGLSSAQYYATLLEDNTRTAARMGGYPDFSKPNLILGGLDTAALIQSASLFYELYSPKGTELGVTSADTYATRNGLTYAQTNSPAFPHDDLLFFQRGVTKFGVDTPWSVRGPEPKYDPATGNIRDTVVYFGREFSTICTPFARQNGIVINKKMRKKVLY